MSLLKFRIMFLTTTVCSMLMFSSTFAQQQPEAQKTETPAVQTQTTPAQPTIVKIYGVQLTIYSLPDKTELSKAPVNNTGAGGFKVSKAGTFFIKATFGKKLEAEAINELKIDVKYPDGTRKTLSTKPAANGKSIESAEFEWTEPAKPLFAYLTSTQGKVNTLPLSEANKK